MESRIFNVNELKIYKYVVIISFYKGKILLSRHKERTTWETQGGHIECGETPLQAAKRELYEESGAVEFDIQPLCDYWAGDTLTGKGENGMVFTANIKELSMMPESEMAEVKQFDSLPNNLTYPEITPVLFTYLRNHIKIEYRKLTIDDLDIFIRMRINQLREEGAESDYDLAPELKKYYIKHISDNTFVSWVAVDNGKIIGTSGISFVEKPPYYGCTSGKIGLISSMYTDKSYRRQGIAKILLGKIVEEAKNYGCKVVQITASDMGVMLYTDFGFKKNSNFMYYTF